MIVNKIPIGLQYLIQTDTDRWCLIDLLLVVLPWEAYVGEVRVRVRDISHMWERSRCFTCNCIKHVLYVYCVLYIIQYTLYITMYNVHCTCLNKLHWFASD